MTEQASYSAIGEQIRRGDYAAAEEALAALSDESPDVRLLRLELELYSDAAPALAIQQRLIQLMRQHPDLPRSRDVYREASERAYEQQASSAAHSHPPSTRGK